MTYLRYGPNCYQGDDLARYGQCLPAWHAMREVGHYGAWQLARTQRGASPFPRWRPPRWS
jgi:hypothetical protein